MGCARWWQRWGRAEALDDEGRRKIEMGRVLLLLLLLLLLLHPVLRTTCCPPRRVLKQPK